MRPNNGKAVNRYYQIDGLTARGTIIATIFVKADNIAQVRNYLDSANFTVTHWVKDCIEHGVFTGKLYENVASRFKVSPVCWRYAFACANGGLDISDNRPPQSGARHIQSAGRLPLPQPRYLPSLLAFRTRITAHPSRSSPPSRSTRARSGRSATRLQRALGTASRRWLKIGPRVEAQQEREKFALFFIIFLEKVCFFKKNTYLCNAVRRRPQKEKPPAYASGGSPPKFFFMKSQFRGKFGCLK